ncbi:hypothetical protein Vadar_034736 [Vaccinium darrowii]|uniref:Uncharacterized protein n=1 Tax=Vaccinium darrowii TaxID=229202 RepID=A0ACB7Z9H9_9ERIC|nr:hypothetical protein Vadar_034736 [Vaccinium darrowii]
MKQKRSTKQKRNMKPINITDLNVDVLKLIMVFVAKSSDGARSFARTTSVCKGFLELAEDTEVLKTVVFDKGRVSRFGESFWKIDGLLCKCLQQMLADKAFRGYEDTSENWVLSITSLFGALNGTTRAYLDGVQPEDGRSMKPICLLQLLRLGVIFYYNFGFDHFNMSWKNIGVWGLADCLMGNTGHFASELNCFAFHHQQGLRKKSMPGVMTLSALKESASVLSRTPGVYESWPAYSE